jgi:hypothetical protein
LRLHELSLATLGYLHGTKTLTSFFRAVDAAMAACATHSGVFFSYLHARHLTMTNRYKYALLSQLAEKSKVYRWRYRNEGDGCFSSDAAWSVRLQKCSLGFRRELEVRVLIKNSFEKSGYA